jgi:DNA-binding Lrp family transcriptional regulator
MDGADIRILGALQNDGRLANNDLAEKVGLSPSQCSRRRAALEDNGVITGYHATLSSDALGLDVLVFVHVTLATHSPTTPSAFWTWFGASTRFKRLIRSPVSPITW